MFIRRKLDDILGEAAGSRYLCIEDETGNYTLITGMQDELLEAVLEQIYSVLYEDLSFIRNFR